VRATTILKTISECLCNTIESSQVPNVCFCGVVPGDGIVADFAGNCRDERQGMAWVRQTSIYPAAGLNVVDETANNCKTGFGMDLELGILRPMVTIDDRGNPPSPEQYEESAALMNDDALVMVKALQCCDALDEVEYVLGQYTPAGPLGGMVGGSWVVAVLL
jgi:hypothetical protein